MLFVAINPHDSSLQPTANKKKTFNDNEEALHDVDAIESVATQAKTLSTTDSDLPEEVSADNTEILRLKELHEKLTDGNEKRSKRRKLSEKQTNSSLADKALDSSVFDSLPKSDDESEGANDDDEQAEGNQPTWKIDVRKSNSRKM